MNKPPLPLASAEPDIAPFFAAAAEGRLIVRHCVDCDRAYHYPRNFCPFCLGDRVEWRDCGGTASIEAFTVLRRADPIVIVAYVRLAEGPLMLTNLVDADPSALAIGDPLVAVFRAGLDGIPIPMFARKEVGA